MLSSTSSSEREERRRAPAGRPLRPNPSTDNVDGSGKWFKNISGGWIFAALASIAAVLGGMEAATRLEFDKISKLQRRVYSERATITSELTKPSSEPTVLMVGNSLLLEGVDFDEFRNSLSPRARAYRYIVTQTVYWDWYYGVRRLFSEGVRPTYLLLGMSPSQLTRSGSRGDFSAFYLFDLRGIIQYSHDEHLDLTTASSLLFAHASQFYAARSEIRASLIEKFFPSYFEALHHVTDASTPQDDSRIQVQVAERLASLDQLCRANGVKLVFVIPPTDEKSEPPAVAAGLDAGVPVFLPVSRHALTESQFADGFHLNAQGRKIFTRALIGTMETVLPKATKSVEPVENAR
jgi:hypothetical protein